MAYRKLRDPKLQGETNAHQRLLYLIPQVASPIHMSCQSWVSWALAWGGGVWGGGRLPEDIIVLAPGPGLPFRLMYHDQSDKFNCALYRTLGVPSELGDL